ncbi:MAG: hypothetical protein WB801_09035 [Candidatus Dormiibacterota bacterium]
MSSDCPWYELLAPTRTPCLGTVAGRHTRGAALATWGLGATRTTSTNDAKFRDTMEFRVYIDYSYGLQKLEFEVTVRKGYNGRLSWES